MNQWEVTIRARVKAADEWSYFVATGPSNRAARKAALQKAETEFDTTGFSWNTRKIVNPQGIVEMDHDGPRSRRQKRSFPKLASAPANRSPASGPDLLD